MQEGIEQPKLPETTHEFLKFCLDETNGLINTKPYVSDLADRQAELDLVGRIGAREFIETMLFRFEQERQNND